MFSEEIVFAIALRSCPMIGDATFRKLVKIAGSAKEAWELSSSQINKLPRIPSKIAENIGNVDLLNAAENEVQFCIENQIGITYNIHEPLPGLLNECDDAPVLLYSKGKFPSNKNSLSIVGTRNITAYGRRFVHDFLSELSGKNVQTISGLALGTDTCVHEESINNNIPTVAVLAHGLQIIYPTKNTKLADKVLENGGCLLTEYTSTQALIREKFLQRNRIVAGISATTIIVETAYGGGSMSTANYAANYNREVLALPGNIDHKQSQGCNLLISQNKARIISGIKETIEYLGLDSDKTDQQLNLFSAQKDTSMLSTEQLVIHDCINNQPNVSLDEIAEKLEIPTYKILPILLDLEIFGFIKSTSGRQYRTM